jgi:Fe-S cluster assembly iron-binding protein IscA
MQQDVRKKLLFISVKAEQNCVGFRYESDLRDSAPANNVILKSSEGIALAIDSDDVAFLKGTTLDYLADPGGFKFSHG